jgi:hypothetical protein
MPRLVLIHFGAHRTGTTYLQQALSRNRDKLAARDIHYVSVHESPEIRQAFLQARYALRDGNDTVAESNLQVVADFLSAHLRSNTGNILISYEGFLGDLCLRHSRRIYPNHAELIARLMRIFEGERVHAAFAVREYGAFVESGYKYLAQTGLKVGFRRYIAGVDLEQLAWRPIVVELQKTFGSGLSLWTYEDFAQSPAEAVEWLFQRSFERSSKFLQLPSEASNASASRVALPGLLLWNRLFRRHRKASNGIYRLLLRYLPASRFGYPRLIDRAAKDALRSRYARDLDAMRADVAGFYCPTSAGSATVASVGTLPLGTAAAAH